MIRITWAFLAALLCVLPSPARAGEKVLAGNWKVTVLAHGQHSTLWIVHFEAKEGKWSGQVIGQRENAPAITNVTDLNMTPDLVQFTLKNKTQKFPFQGKLPPAASKSIQGSLGIGSQTFPAEIEPTKLENLDEFEVNKDTLANQSDGPEVIEAASFLISNAEDKKATAEEVAGWADKAFKSAAVFGPRYQRIIALRVAELLNDQDGLASVAVDYAQRAEKLLKPDDKASARKPILNALAEALTKAGKTEEAREVEARNQKIEWPQLVKVPGRKDNSDKVVLVELFTGAQCPPCVAIDLAFDALAETYQPSEVVLVEYHLHIPGPDPLTNPDAEARQKYYGDDVSGTPAIIFNGKVSTIDGGYYDDAEGKYGEFVNLINPLLNEAAKAKLKASAVRKGDKVQITAEASELAKAGSDVRLRLALVEEHVQYRGGNKIPSYHQVVRSLPGGPAGLALRDKTGKVSVTVDLKELRNDLGTYLADIAKETPFPKKDRPFDLKNLRLVAFVQDDATKEVLQAIQVNVRPEESGQ